MFYTTDKIAKQLPEIRAAIYRETQDIPTWRFHEGDVPGAEQIEFDDRDWPDFRVGETWGGYDVQAWFRTRVSIPREWKRQKLALKLLVGPRDTGGSSSESLVYVNAFPLQGIDHWHDEVWLPNDLLRGDEISVAIKAWSGVLEVPDRRRFKVAQLVVIDPDAECFYYLADTILKTVNALDENDLRRIKLLAALDDSFRSLDFSRPGSPSFYQSVHDAGQILQKETAELSQTDEIKPRVVGVGHSHLDMAWLWRLNHTREKASRTFATALNLMRQYPEYRFLHTSPQLYTFLEQDYPQLFAEVKARIAAGEWEIAGSMWVEPDINIPSGESLVRQILFGKQYMRGRFGVDSSILWMPDVFGYSYALPQILDKSGIKYFMTTKLSWNQYNRFPYDTFHWRGIDGTQVLAHFVTTPEEDSSHYAYIGRLEPFEVKGIWDNYRQKEVNDELLLLYGWGDGGGGPTKEMLESARVMSNLPGLPRVELGEAEPYFKRLEKRVTGKDLPVWDGELYLEYHRGTYTSQGYNKRANRQSEVLYHDAEFLSAIADILHGSNKYPAASLREGWELLLLNQFHDILPGSSIRQVYEDSARDYDRVRAIGERALGGAVESLAGDIACASRSLVVFNSLSTSRSGLVELPWTDELEEMTLAGADGSALPSQLIERDGQKRLLLAAPDIPSLGYRAFPLMQSNQESLYHSGGASLAGEESLEATDQKYLASLTMTTSGQATAPGNGHNSPGTNGKGSSRKSALAVIEPRDLPLPGALVAMKQSTRNAVNEIATAQTMGLAMATPEDSTLRITPTRLENRYYNIELNSRGQIISLYDKENKRQVLAPNARANVLQAFEDKPMSFDAWDIDIYYQQKMVEIDELAEAVVEEAGPLRGALKLVWEFGESTVTQRMMVYRDSRRIDFQTEIDWHQDQVLLKAAFPVDVRATHATYDIQFGSIERPNHWNTSWDYARFEVCAHKWADLSEGNYGVALLNDCKYGYDVKDNVLRLTLLKSAIRPDPLADKGRHEFTYSLLPHARDWREGGVAEEGYALNYPLRYQLAAARSSGALPSDFSFVRTDAPNVVVETFKRAEDSKDGEAWIVRVYENKQYRCGEVNLLFGLPVRKAVECNLIEEQEMPAAYDERCVTFPIAPFEIKTFKVWF